MTKKSGNLNNPWFKDGLRFECNKCNICCGGEPGVIWVNAEDIIKIADFLKMPVDKFSEKYLRKMGIRYSLLELANGDCIMLENGCKIYPVRPYQCISFPFWLQNVETEDEWKGLKDKCPGIDKGRLYSLKEISDVISK